MERLDIYKKYVDKLIQEGKAYYAWETPEELEAMRQEARKQKKPFIYRQIQYTPEQLEKFKAE
jgi:nondiscriminating glutamyl-tRNA synthetase